MSIVDDKEGNFYDGIFNVLDGRGVNCLPVSNIEIDEKSKPADTFIANVDQSFDCLKNQEFLTFLKKNKNKIQAIIIVIANGLGSNPNPVISVILLPIVDKASNVPSVNNHL